MIQENQLVDKNNCTSKCYHDPVQDQQSLDYAWKEELLD